MVTMDRYEFACLRLDAHISRAQLINLCDISPRTLRRWQDSGQFPACVIALLKALAADLSLHGWPGWHFAGGRLWPPGCNAARHAYRMRDVDWIPAGRWVIAGYERIARSQAAVERGAQAQLVAQSLGALRQALAAARQAEAGLSNLLLGPSTRRQRGC